MPRSTLMAAYRWHRAKARRSPNADAHIHAARRIADITHRRPH